MVCGSRDRVGYDSPRPPDRAGEVEAARAFHRVGRSAPQPGADDLALAMSPTCGGSTGTLAKRLEETERLAGSAEELAVLTDPATSSTDADEALERGSNPV